MKTKRLIVFIFLILMIGISRSFAQAPQQFNYQGAARNTNGTPLANKQISIKISILDGSPNGNAQYVETRSITTNQLGLYSLAIGSPGASSTSGSIGSVTWSNGLKYIKVEIDPYNGNSFSLAGTAQLLSVPYALYAGASASGTSNTILNGNTTPSAGLGNNGDFYIDVTTNTFYGPKANGSWPAGKSIAGATGPQGPAGAKGTDGINGTNGRGIASAVSNANGSITFTYTDGTSFTTIPTTNILTKSGTNLTSTVNGVASSTDLQSIISAGTTVSNALNGTNLTTTVNGVTGTAVDIQAAVNAGTSVSNTSSGNTLSTTVNGVTGTAVNMVNSNTIGLNGTSLTTTVNGVASTALDLAPAINAASTNTLAATNGNLVSTVNGVSSSPAVAVITSASNGLNSTNGEVKMGGALNNPTTITTDATNTLTLAGLQTGTTTDKIVTTDANGVLKSVDRSTFDADLRLTGNNNHITSDAGVGSNGTSAGTGSDNIAIGATALSNISTGDGNIALGKSALQSNTTGARNIAIGKGTLVSNTTGILNVATGYNALNANTTGNYNAALGPSALLFNTSGNQNIAMGFGALLNNKIGNYNAALGASALVANTSGYNNTAMGTGALESSTGNANSALGTSAGKGLSGGNGNVFIGANTGFNTLTTASNQLFIGNASGDNALIRGDFSTKVLTINNTLKVADLASTATATTGNRPVVADANGQLKIGAATATITTAIVTVNTAYTVLATDRTIIADATSAGFTITLPSAAANTGRELIIRKADETTNVLTFDQNLKYSVTTNINSVNSLSTLHLQSDGTNWWVISKGL